jgi:outer membrane protein assembly factor BamE (lipoprotein component of BamABCDE complex)
MRRFVFGCTLLAALTAGFPGCRTAQEHQQSLPSAQEREMTVGIVQKEIRVGMSGAEVAAALGSPNIVTRDGEGRETWVYDKIASEVAYSYDRGGVAGGTAGGLAGNVAPYGLIIGGLGGSYSRGAGAAASTQKTLTVVIRFDRAAKVETFTYHASKF